jgi:hypothetical protein
MMTIIVFQITFLGLKDPEADVPEGKFEETLTLQWKRLLKKLKAVF